MRKSCWRWSWEACGLIAILIFAYTLHLDPGTAAGLGSGSLTQTSMMGTASGALEGLALPADRLAQEQANMAAGYAVTYICGYILVLLFVPLVAPRLMGVNLKEEAIKLEAALSGGAPAKPGNLLYRKFQARAYQVSTAAGRTVSELEAQIGRRTIVERILRGGEDVEPRADAKLQAGDEILLAGPSGAIVAAAPMIGHEIEGEHVMRAVPGDVVEVYVTARNLHGLTLSEIVERFGDRARGVFMRSLTRRGQEVPITPGTQIYVGDVMTLVGLYDDLKRVVPLVGQPFRSSDRTDIAYLTGGLAVGLLVGLLSVKIGPIPLTLGGGGGALVAGLVAGWLRSRRPTMGAFPPAAQQSLADLGLAGFVAAIGLASRSGRGGSHSGSWAHAVGRGHRRDADAPDHRHTVRSPRSAHESRHHLWRSRRGHDGRRSRRRLLRGRAESNPGPWRGGALRHCQCRLDGPRADHRWSDFCRMSGPIGSRNVVERTSIVPGQKEAEMRWVHLSVIILFAAITIIFAVQNFQVVTVSFLRFSVQTPLALLVVVIYLVGTLTGGSLLALLRQAIERARL